MKKPAKVFILGPIVADRNIFDFSGLLLILLGGVDDHTRQTPTAGGGKLVIKASALLGGIEIKN